MLPRRSVTASLSGPWRRRIQSRTQARSARLAEYAAEWRAGHAKHPGRLWVLVAKREFLGPDLNTADAQ